MKTGPVHQATQDSLIHNDRNSHRKRIKSLRSICSLRSYIPVINAASMLPA
jgi:hypothetical protein